MIHAVIMAGGSGTRFWPMSRRNRPKHLLPLTGSATLIQGTLSRIAALVPADRTWVITAADHADEVRRQLHELPEESIVAEPCPRDTAPCVALAASLVARRDPDAVLVVMPADHVIEPDAEFHRSVEAAARLIAEDPRRLVTIGVKPQRPATGYGYVHRGARLRGAESPAAFAVHKFTEKPSRAVAEQFVASNEYYWNSGIFVWSAATILREIRATRPQLADAVARIGNAWDTPARATTLATEFEKIERISIDYAVLETSQNVVVIEAGFRWDDVGSWAAIPRLAGSDANGNSVIGPQCGIETKDTIVLTDPDHLVATLGVENLIIVQCGNATLVARRDQDEAVKRLVELIRQQGHETFL